MAEFQHNVSKLNHTLSHIFGESTFDGLILNVCQSGMKILDHNYGHCINYILNQICYELQIVFSAY
jgi:hypothetical protein